MYAKAIHTCRTCGAEYASSTLAARCHPHTKQVFKCGKCDCGHDDLRAAQLCCTTPNETQTNQSAYVPMHVREVMGQMRLY